MPQVQMPNGVTLQFPDGMDQAAMQAAAKNYWNSVSSNAVQTQFPSASAEMVNQAPQQPATASPEMRKTAVMPQDGGFLDNVGGALGEFAKGVGRGAMDFARTAFVETPLNPLNIMVGAQAAMGDERSKEVLAKRDRLTQTPQSLTPTPETTLQRYAGTVGEFAPAALLPGGLGARGAGVLPKVAAAGRNILAPAVASEAAGTAFQGTSLEGPARVAGAVLAPVGIGMAGRAGARAISPFGGADEATLKAARALEAQGIPVSAGQKVDSQALKRLEGTSGKGQQFFEGQRKAFTGAALENIGQKGELATPEVLSRASQEIGGIFQSATKGAKVTPTPQNVSALQDASSTYSTLAPKATQAPIIGEIARRFQSSAKSKNPIDASTLNTWRSNLSKLTTSSDTATREAAKQALGAVDDALEQSLVNAGRADDVTALRQARSQYRDLLAIQNAASRAGSETAQGIISPSNLRGTVAAQGKAAYAQGRRGDLADLARQGEIAIKPPSSSGTAENLRSMGLLGGIGAGGGAILGGPAGAIAGALAPTVAPRLAMTAPAQSYLANQFVGQGPSLMSRGQGAATAMGSLQIDDSATADALARKGYSQEQIQQIINAGPSVIDAALMR